MKRILGLDLGSASIGWAMIVEKEENGKTKCEIFGLGSRIIRIKVNIIINKNDFYIIYYLPPLKLQ